MPYGRPTYILAPLQLAQAGPSTQQNGQDISAADGLQRPGGGLGLEIGARKSVRKRVFARDRVLGT